MSTMYLIAFLEVTDGFTFSITVPTIFKAPSIESIFVDMDDRLSSITKMYNKGVFVSEERTSFAERYDPIFDEGCIENIIYRCENGSYDYNVPSIITLDDWMKSSPTLKDKETRHLEC